MCVRPQVQHFDNTELRKCSIWIEPYATNDILALVPQHLNSSHLTTYYNRELIFKFGEANKTWEVLSRASSSVYTLLLRVSNILLFFTIHSQIIHLNSNNQVVTLVLTISSSNITSMVVKKHLQWMSSRMNEYLHFYQVYFLYAFFFLVEYEC